MKVILRGTVLKRYLSLRTLIAKVVSLIGYNAFRFLNLFAERISNLPSLSNPNVDMIALLLTMSEMNECMIYM